MSEAPEYADLAEYLAAHAGIVALLDDISALSALAGEVKVAAVRSLLLARDPNVLNPDEAETFIGFLEVLNGIATEVESIVGTNPATNVRKLAVWAITVGVASSIESSLFPEQQIGGQDASASQLQIRYLSLLKRLGSLPGAGSAEGALGILGPVGDFPSALAYPDPARP